MKDLLPIYFVTPLLLLSVGGHFQGVKAQKGGVNNSLLAQAKISENQLELPVALPQVADVVFNRGESISGQIIEIDNQQQRIVIRRRTNTRAVDLKNVEKITFRNSSIVYRSNGRSIIRGERARPVSKPVTWQGISLDNFRLKDPEKGQALVVLKPPVVSLAQLKGIRSVARNRTYVVEDLKFNLRQKSINITATPY